MPMPAMNSALPSQATNDLGLGGMLKDQVAGETEEQRKKRMLQLQQQQSGGSLATMSLFGGGLGGT